MIVIHLIVFVVLGFIEFPVVRAEDVSGPQRPLLEIVTQPAYMVAAAGAMIAFGVMSFVMAASPLAIVQCGLSKSEAPITIFVHVMGMFLPAFFTGHLIQRFGIFNIMTAGIALLIGGVAIALLGTTEWHFRGALGLNGVGWNFLFVGATTLLTTTYRQAERGKAQAFNDFMVFGTTAMASLMASVVLEVKGWAYLNYLAFAMVCVALLVIGIFRLRNPGSRDLSLAGLKPLSRWGFCGLPLLRVPDCSVIFRPPRAGGDRFIGADRVENTLRTNRL